MAYNNNQSFNNNREIRITGLSRSGNHAVINWILSQKENSYCFLNCVEPKHNPFYTPRPLNLKGEVLASNIPGLDIEKEKQGNFAKKHLLLYSYEDCFLGTLNHPYFISNREKWVGTSRTKQDILLLRDPFNLFASRIKADLIVGHQTHHGVNPISTNQLKRIYKQHAKEFLGIKKNLKNKVLINYNLWTSEKSYRKGIADKLDIPFTDQGFEEVANCAGGSSFDGVQYSGNANKMNLSNRWKEYASEDYYWELFDNEIIDLAREIFGNIPPVEFSAKVYHYGLSG